MLLLLLLLLLFYLSNLTVMIKLHVHRKGRGSTTLGHQWYDVQ